ncbi:MAG: hypothetical protein B7Y12_05790 [Rhizobiales bacterium 24-66-13]|nr:MAG: hypothetical protein B7Y61_07230 [Rhizobiales bacterium 35-66-30]OYZ81874.1 MAG: hypothetical protein B7Y12_05790 [Rhizobiales bacterium 24-66-13]OZB05298.1 MAG: hypothetical protein B7X67_12350 [Rhizobiales bacterium 39-66-18]HQS11007.1 autotransporter domain-containing protein [Xanthobacteraceae bacterium]HQS49781.1 autotransporter domain-containing protein [Xanthobacteraceae bacterium]
MRSFLAAVSLALLSSTALAQTAPPKYTSLWSLGDSLTDVGRTGGLLVSPYPKGPLYYNNHFSNGEVWVEYLSKLNNIQYNKDRNLAWGGAVTGNYYDKRLVIIRHLEVQVTNFKDKAGGKLVVSRGLGLFGNTTFYFSPNNPATDYGSKPLITLTIGGNNFRQYIEDGSFQNLIGYKDDLNTEKNAILKNVPVALRSIQKSMDDRKDIAQSGATYYVWTVADVSTTPKLSSLEANVRRELSDAVKDTNRSLKSELYKLGDEFSQANHNSARIVVVDAAAFLAEVQVNPTAYGFKNSKDNCIDADTGAYAGACSAANVGDYLFWDQFHPTTKAHEMIAQYAQNTDWLEYGAPVTIALPYVANIELRPRTFAGTIGGAGSIIKQGEATLTLAGANTYAGGTRIDAGTVRVSSDANLGARSGLLTLRGGAISASDSFAMQRNVTITGAGGTFDADRNVTLTLTGNTLSGDGNLTKTGAGVLDIRSTMATSADGMTEAVKGVGRQLTSLAGGTLKVNTTNPYISYRIETQSGTVLGGSGTIITGRKNEGGGILAAGLIAPGNSIGTLTIDGDLTLTDSSIYSLEVDASRGDQLVVTGNFTMDGAISIVTDPTDKLTTQTLAFATSTGTVAGAYDEVVDLSPFLSETLHYGAGTVAVTFARNFAAPAVSANQRAVAAHLNASYLSVSQGDLDNVFYGLDTSGTNAAGANALDQLSGVSIGNLLTSSAIQRGQFTRALEDRMSARRAGRDIGTVAAGTSAFSVGADNSGLGGALADASYAMNQTGSGTAGGGDREPNGVSAWARVLGGPANVAGAGSYDMTGVGVLIGVDKSFDTGLAGVSFAYGNFSTEGVNSGDASADTYQISAYGSLQQGNLFLDATLAYAYADYSTNRLLAFGTLSRLATGSSDGNDVSLSAKAGGVYAFGTGSFEPSLGFDWYHLTRGAFTETTAGSAGLIVGSQTLDLIMPSVGARLSTLYNAGTFTLSPELSARYYYNFGDTDVATTAGLIGAPAAPFTVTGTGIGHNIGVLAAGLSAQQNDNLRVSAQYELQLSDNVTAQAVSLGLRYTW